MKSFLIYSIIAIACNLLFSGMQVSAQSNKVPPFRMVQSNSKLFLAADLPMGKPIIIFYFSPECEDCQKETEALLAHIEDLKKASIAMITYLSVETVSQFVTKNKLDKHPNIFVGTEGNYLLVKNYYTINQFPFLALYNKNGDLIKKYYSTELDLNDLLVRLKNL